jgi:hypothetical protein
MAKVTGFGCIDEQGYPLACDAYGNNVAFRCPGCGGPVLAVIRENQRGSSPKKPSRCPGCGSRAWLELDGRGGRLVVHRMPAKPPS